MRSRLSRAGLPVAGALIFLALWQWLAGGPMRNTNLPYATGTLRALSRIVTESGFWGAVGSTMTEVVAGFAISVAVGVPLGLYVGLSPLGYNATRVLIEVTKSIPAVIILPIVVLHLGTTSGMAVVLIVFTLVPQLIVTTLAGARDADPVMLDVARSYRLGSIARTWRVVVPNAVPFIATGLRVSAAIALVVAVLAGIVGGAPGLGHDLETYRQQGYLETVFGYVIALGVLGIALNALLTLGERRVIHWHVSVRAQRPHGVDSSRPVTARGPRFERWWPLLDRVDSVLVAARSRRVVRRLGSALRRGSTRRGSARATAALRVVAVVTPLALLAVWWFASSGSTDPYTPAASDILSSFRTIWFSSSFSSDAIPSLRNLVVGLAIAIVAGIALGVVIAELRWLHAMTSPLISFFRAIPAIAYLPLLISVLGFGGGMRIAAISLGALFPVLLATVDGIRSIDSTVLDVTRSYRVGRVQRLVSVQLPSAAPRIMTGIELSIVAALVVMVASELMGAPQGIGAQVIMAQQYFRFTDMWAGVVLLAIVGVAVNLSFRLVRGRVLSWYDGSRAAGKTN
ncbi:ABC transporter permease [Streptomyces brasiliensis]|uniref:ABC transmembrane type-1 domain-containing protein n=1 Tax=Streptomyces brasiliensis TaxID=1954 RepID=A0A917P3X9_9ACTN|nr:ABC transporter permease [Streptomyces brasiliensis]GGJ60399.1 hypothetical protein GCM10010121_083760 [Streptomyces brasiliensis]